MLIIKIFDREIEEEKDIMRENERKRYLERGNEY